MSLETERKDVTSEISGKRLKMEDLTCAGQGLVLKSVGGGGGQQARGEHVNKERKLLSGECKAGHKDRPHPGCSVALSALASTVLGCLCSQIRVGGVGEAWTRAKTDWHM